ncbi:MAG: sodium-dependent transporter [Gammaproteobacteria bacterium]|nr:sodium-dependent transporter [Gammaproteobacteria bacterium]
MSSNNALTSNRSWGSYSAFLLAAVGSSIGLGNLWKFPYELGEHGGTFLYLYFACVLLVGFPLIVSELMIGRLGQANPLRGIGQIVQEFRYSILWKLIAWMGVVTSFLVFSFYSVVASWILFYTMQSVTGAYMEAPAEIVRHSFKALLRNSDQMLIWHSVFVLMVVSVLAQPVRKGVERAVRLLMPVFALFVVWLVFELPFIGDVESAKAFIFHFDWEEINSEMIVSALAQALFSLSIGIGILILYGSYLSEDRPLLLGGGAIAIFDSMFAVAMGFFILAIVFNFDLQPDVGPSLIFETLPVAFSQVSEQSILAASSFFLLLLIAALTSGFALLEPSIAMLVDRTGWSRRLAAWIVGVVAWGAGLLSVFSFQTGSFGFYYFGTEYKHGYFDLFNIIATDILLPLTALLVTMFAGWVLPKRITYDKSNLRPMFTYRIWRFCSRVVAPIIIGIALFIVLAVPA